MASGAPRLKLIVSRAARVDLMEIYAYNAEHRSPAEADRYEEFLLTGIAKLEISYADGKPIEGFPLLQSVILGRGTRGYGHVIIYRVDEVAGIVRVLHVFHSAMDIRGRLLDEA